MLSTTSSIALAIAIYLPIQHVLRHQRERQTARKYGHKSRNDLARMTMAEAGEIMRELIELEMTDAFNISLGYGFLQVRTSPPLRPRPGVMVFRRQSRLTDDYIKRPLIFTCLSFHWNYRPWLSQNRQRSWSTLNKSTTPFNPPNVSLTPRSS
jgi:hypothetical protein